MRSHGSIFGAFVAALAVVTQTLLTPANAAAYCGAFRASPNDDAAREALARGDVDAARGHLERALAKAKASGDDRAVASIHADIGRLARAERDFRAAEQSFRLSMEIARRARATDMMAQAAFERGHSMLDASGSDARIAARAETYFEFSRDLAGQDANRSLQIQALAASALATGGDWGRAAAHLRDALAVADGLGAQDDRAAAALLVSTVVLQLEPTDPQLQPLLDDALLRAARVVSWGSSNDHLTELYHGQLARQSLLRGNATEALALSERALFLSETATGSGGSYVWRGLMGEAYAALGQRPEALEAFAASLTSLLSEPQAYGGGSRIEARWRTTASERILAAYTDTLLAENPSTEDLRSAQRAIEASRRFELAALENVCITEEAVELASFAALPGGAAVVYPVALTDRLDFLVVAPQAGAQGPLIRRASADASPEEIASLADQFRRALRRPTTDDAYDAGALLYEAIMPPLAPILRKAEATTLVFAPEGSLRGVPIGALYNRSTDRFVIEDYAVATVVGLSVSAPSPLESSNMHSLLAGLSMAVDGFSPLPHVPAELNAIGSSEAMRTQVLLDEAFTEDVFARAIENEAFSIVHLATHGQFKSSSSQSFLLTAEGRINLDELDVLARTARIRGIPIELLVLSACETAAGDQDAVLGLAGAAFRSGARAVIASLWPINDASTARLMPELYSSLGEGKSRAAALRQAQQALISDPETRHPHYWAAFILLGNWM